jgi:hypothetical protein
LLAFLWLDPIEKPQPIVGITVAPAPEEPKVPVYTLRFSLNNIAEFTSHALGSKGYLIDDTVVCTGTKGGQCIIVIEFNYDEKWVYFQDCGVTTTPIATLDTETQEWVITFTKRVQLL